VAKAYRLLKEIFNTAVDDGLIRRNLSRTVGGGKERSAERPVLTVEQSPALPRQSAPVSRARAAGLRGHSLAQDTKSWWS